MGVLNIFLLCLVAMMAANISNVMAVCCRARWGMCADGTKGTPYCGYQTCNFWGCACGGGKCRSGPCHRGKRSANQDGNVEAMIALFKSIDTNKDNKVTKSEMAASQLANTSNVEADFAHADQNNDGKITLDEIGNISE